MRAYGEVSTFLHNKQYTTSSLRTDITHGGHFCQPSIDARGITISGQRRCISPFSNASHVECPHANCSISIAFAACLASLRPAMLTGHVHPSRLALPILSHHQHDNTQSKLQDKSLALYIFSRVICAVLQPLAQVLGKANNTSATLN